ncbi:MAG: tRNA uridine-5-carboxymethylaminomethyl(34) synthesis GTPase MnmE [Betaproteobacteria bacterium]
MLGRQQDPIVAIATAPGRGAVGMIRVSGVGLAPLARALCGSQLLPRQATYGPFKDANGQVIDKGLAIFFPAPASYTGEDVLELQAHGGPAVLRLLLQRCLQAASQTDEATGQLRLPHLRLAEPGEFTRRAFLNGKMDLAQAEAVADLIDATTEAGARSAARSLVGAFSLEIEALLQQLVRLRMAVEATLDFPEEDIDFIKKADVHGQLQALRERVAEVQARATQGAILREGIRVVIAGQPNAGKSSLLNALAGAERAIVTPIAGTTRDKVTELIQIDGVPLHVTDTAGLRESSDLVEKIGIERAWQEIRAADAVLFLHDWPRYRAADAHGQAYRELDAQIAQQLPAGLAVLQVWNKIDSLAPDDQAPEGLFVSAKTGEGLQALRQALLDRVGWQGAEGLYMARARHLHALEQVMSQLEVALQQLQAQEPALDLLAEDLRQAHNALAQITGEFTSDDLLGVIFASFCIGK